MMNCSEHYTVTNSYQRTDFTLSFSLRFNGHFPGEPGLAAVYWSKRWWKWWWQLDYWSYKSCKAPVKSSLPTNQHPVFLQAVCPSCRPTNSVKAVKGKISHSIGLAYPKLTWVFQLCLWPLIAPGYLGEGCHASHQPSDASTSDVRISLQYRLRCIHHYILRVINSFTWRSVKCLQKWYVLFFCVVYRLRYCYAGSWDVLHHVYALQITPLNCSFLHYRFVLSPLQTAPLSEKNLCSVQWGT